MFRVRDHIRRLLDSAKIYRIEMKYSTDELAGAMVELVRPVMEHDAEVQGRQRGHDALTGGLPVAHNDRRRER